MEKDKECNHIFHSVYYGSQWEVECQKCNKNIYDIYEKEDANEIISKLLIKNNQKYNFRSFGTPQESIDEDNYWNPQTEEQKRFGCLVDFAYIAIVALIAYFLL